MIFIS